MKPVTSGENKRKHLEFIQGAITRMANNAFSIKKWAVSLIAILSTIVTATDSQGTVIVALALMVLMFWGLDGFFLATERRFIKEFQHVSAKSEEEIDFVINPLNYKNEKCCTWSSATFSKTVAPFYGGLLVMIIVIGLLYNGGCLGGLLGCQK